MEKKRTFSSTPIISGHLLEDKFSELEDALRGYLPHILEKEPKDIEDIYKYYSQVDSLYVWLKNAYEDDLCVLCNEMRAILGHLSEYDENTEPQKNNLGKAYGHLRRLSLDTLKILCNGMDQVFYEWIQSHAGYDYRNKDNAFLPEYIELYYTAHNSYLDIQKDENLGSDRQNNIIEKYHKSAMNFLNLYRHHTNERRKKIDKITARFKFNKCAWAFGTIAITLVSVIGFFIK